MSAGGYAPQGARELIRRIGKPFTRLAEDLGVSVEALSEMEREDYAAPPILTELFSMADAADPGRRPAMYREELYCLCDAGLTAERVADVLGVSHSVAQRKTKRGKNPLSPVLFDEAQADALRALVK